MLHLVFFLLLQQYIYCASKFIVSILFVLFIVVIDITVQPVSINTTLNSAVVFSCEGTGDVLSVFVNNKAATDVAVIDKGFSVATSSTGGTRRAVLQAIAYEHNNNTEINCTALTISPIQTETSDTAMLMIQG